MDGAFHRLQPCESDACCKGVGWGETCAVCWTDAFTILSESMGRRMASGKCFQRPGTSLPSVEFLNLSLGIRTVRFQALHPRVLRPYPESSYSRGLAMLWRQRSSSRINTDNIYWVCRHNGREFHWGTKQTKTSFCWVSSPRTCEALTAACWEDAVEGCCKHAWSSPRHPASHTHSTHLAGGLAFPSP